MSVLLSQSWLKASGGARWLNRTFFATATSQRMALKSSSLTVRRTGYPSYTTTTSSIIYFSEMRKSTQAALSSAISRIKNWNNSTLADNYRSSTLAMVALTTTAILMSMPSSTYNGNNRLATASTEGIVTKKTSVLTSETTLTDAAEENSVDDRPTTTLLNWSGTHSITIPTSQLYEPETIQELEQIVHRCYVTNTPIRPIGSALSPNGIAFHYRHNNTNSAMISMVHLNEILAIDTENMTVTVQAGARVSQVIEALRPYGLTLPNLASIAEQQVGGFIQVGAHGTGASIPPVDDFCTSLKLLTTHMGTLTLSDVPPSAKDSNPVTPTPYKNLLFDLAKVGLGSLGIVTEVTLKCIPAHNLVEHTFVLTRKQAREQINELLKRHKHVRYMWIPYQDAVVVVTNDKEEKESASDIDAADGTFKVSSEQELAERKQYQFEPLTELLLRKSSTFSREQVQDMGFGELRDQLLAMHPLNVEHVKQCNEAEAEFWRRSQGRQIKPSDELLQFDCGGQQWVWEVCFPTGCYDVNNGNDMKFMEDLLSNIELHGIAAPAPIEQRWSASSSSLMSPAYSPKKDDLHCWVGIIMYLPSSDEHQCNEISRVFLNDYCTLMKRVGSKVNAASHWAKLELPDSPEDLQTLKQLLRTRYPVEYFNIARYILDPTNLLSNDLIEILFGNPTEDITHLSDRFVKG